MYIGLKEIEETITHLEDEAGQEYGSVTVTYKDGNSDTFTQKQFDAAKSEAPLDATALREQTLKPVIADMLRVLLEWNVRTGDIDYISTLLITSLIENTNAAERKLWGKDRLDVTLAEIDKVLRQAAKDSLST